MEQKFFTASHCDAQVINKSSSGGMFSAITDEWFSVYGSKAVVYGCVLDENLNARHIRAVNIEERNKMRGSKYISSNVSGIYKSVADDLKNGCYVLFSGTPCQVAAVNAYLSVCNVEKNSQFITVEVICHGVGSNKFFDDYIKNLESKYKSEAVFCSFRAKSKPGKKQDMQVVFKNGKKFTASSTNYDWFYSAYTKNYILRPACFKCKFAKRERTADISIADNWNSGNGFESILIINNQTGYSLFENLKNNLNYKEINFDEIHQPNMHNPSVAPEKYSEFWDIYNNQGYLSVQKFLGNNTLKGKARSFAIDTVDKFNLVNSAKAIKKAIGRK